jgi:protein-disulfide isomerase-like protein with CxxC motif
MADVAVEVVEFTDPGCSWAWGTEPKLRRLRWRHGDRLVWRRVMGGLVGDMERYVDGFDAVRAAGHFGPYWRRVAERTAMPYPAPLRRMYRSTEPACRAVKAAERQGEAVAERVLRRLREATFVFGDPPDDRERILAALRGVADLDLDRLASELASPEVERAFRADWEETRRPSDQVRNLPEGEGSGRAKHSEGHWRYVFPTLLFRGPGGEHIVAGWQPYEDYAAALDAACPGTTAGPRADPNAEEVLARWGTAARAEIELLCGPATPAPDGTIAHRWEGGELWMTAAEATARELEAHATALDA